MWRGRRPCTRPPARHLVGWAEDEGRPGSACPPPWAASRGTNERDATRGEPARPVRDGRYPVAASTTRLARFGVKEWLPQIGDAGVAAGRLASPASLLGCSSASP